jgi:hypothetical protein
MHSAKKPESVLPTQIKMKHKDAKPTMSGRYHFIKPAKGW